MRFERLLAAAIAISATRNNASDNRELPKVATVRPSGIVFTAEPTALLKLAEVDRNLAFVLHWVIQAQPAAQLKLGGRYNNRHSARRR